MMNINTFYIAEDREMRLGSYLFLPTDLRYVGRLIEHKPKVPAEFDVWADEKSDMVFTRYQGEWIPTGISAKALIMWKRT